MLDHHCLYQHGWATGAWCAGCSADWQFFLRHCGPQVAEATTRARYTAIVEEVCDELLQPDCPPPPPSPHLGVLPAYFHSAWEAAQRSGMN